MQCIKGHPVFQSKGKKRQTAVKDQLAVALWRFGGFGNRASAEAAADWSGYSLGAVLMFSNRVIFALNDPALELAKHFRAQCGGRLVGGQIRDRLLADIRIAMTA
ncbi:BQ2448_3890 [Microbotryum intermedium]|uniref:BQ2448_3890 protein n=1 Tax=Microbotryum intermedium TaxID=269621 RepID=A0A238FK18_9BASI|nr:BQ2448_3890 [Microbotryum intermedium]